MTKWVDPPSGWQYGFPKVVPEGEEPTNEWLVKNGYSQKLIDQLGTAMYVRMWETEDSV